jgi:hypothetical protein
MVLNLLKGTQATNEVTVALFCLLEALIFAQHPAMHLLFSFSFPSGQKWFLIGQENQEIVDSVLTSFLRLSIFV